MPFSLRYSHTCPSEHINVNIIDHVDTSVSRFVWVLWYKIKHWIGYSYNPVDDHSITGYYDKLCELLSGDDEQAVSVENIVLQEEKSKIQSKL